MIIDKRLIEWATEQQKKYIETVNETGSYRAAARQLGLSPDTVRTAIKRLEIHASLKGYSPEHNMVRTVPEAYVIKRRSQNFVERDEDGKLLFQEWVISSPDAEARAQLIRETYEAMANELPRVAPVRRPDWTNEHLANLYTLTDCHMGMLAWHKEGGADWDVKIAEHVLYGCFDQMISGAPRAKVAIVNQLGDFLHSDGLLPVTPTNHHVLDQDGRFSKIVQATVRVLRRIVDRALATHDHVHVIMAEGNHDLASSIWLRVMFKALYENEPRVSVNDNELPFYVYQHGETMLAFHHGHMKKGEALPLLFAAQFPKIWGNTTKRYIHKGHDHHHVEREYSGVELIQHPTLAARDAYASRHGYMATRSARAITYHTKHGEVGRNVVTPEMVGG